MSNFTPVLLAYKVSEPVNGIDEKLTPVIFLHGMFVSKEHWDDIPQTVANITGRKVYAVDARNHGESDWRDDFNFDLNVDDLFHFMDTYNIPKAILIGHSMGGITGIRAALRKPERVEKLIVEDIHIRKIPKAILDCLADTAALLRKACENIPNNIDKDQAFLQIMNNLSKEKLPEIENMFSRDKYSTGHLRLKRKPNGQYTFETNVTVLEKFLRNVDAVASEPEGLYDGPVCFIYGELSPFLVKDEEQHIRKFFPNAEFVCIGGATHNIHPECPTEFNDALLKFLLTI